MSILASRDRVHASRGRVGVFKGECCLRRTARTLHERHRSWNQTAGESALLACQRVRYAVAHWGLYRSVVLWGTALRKIFCKRPSQFEIRHLVGDFKR